MAKVETEYTCYQKEFKKKDKNKQYQNMAITQRIRKARLSISE